MTCWRDALAEIPEENIRWGTEKAKHIGSAFFSLPVFIELCKITAKDMGMPSVESAYHEACTARDLLRFPWSHPAVYHAACDTGIFELRNNVHGTKIRFEENYNLRCQEVLRGKVLELPRHQALPARVSRKLTTEENRQRLAKLREELKI